MPILADFVRRAALLLGATLLVSVVSHAVNAQASANGPFSLRFPSGALIAVGDHRAAIRDAQSTAIQMAWKFHPALSLTGTFAWARSRDRVAAGSPKLDVFTSDVGVESQLAEWCGNCSTNLRVFGGAGAGMRSYNYRSLSADATNNVAGYASAGGDLGFRRVGLRVEARNYIAGFRPLVGPGQSVLRNDVVVLAALRINWRSE